MPDEVTIVRTGSANLASVLAAFSRLGVATRTTTDPAVIRDARRLVLPGVGAFGAAMNAMRQADLVEPVRAYVLAGRPFLAVCLGLQLLCESSDESPGVRGLGIIDVHVGRFAGPITIPQLGWNMVQPDAQCSMLRTGHAYYANSFRLESVPTGWNGALSDHGGSFVAAIEKGPMLACQFHPELSGGWGRELLVRWIERTRASEEVSPC